MNHASYGWATAVGCVLALSGCGSGLQKNAVEAALANDAERATAFEAAARALDEHPEYVDELYLVARRHEPMLHRFIADTTRDLRDPSLARRTAESLTNEPAALEAMLVATVDPAGPKRRARAAIGRAVVERDGGLADVLADHPAAVLKATHALVVAVQHRPAARAAFLESLRRSASQVAEILASDPDTMKVLLGAMLRQENRGGLEEVLKSFGATK